MSENTSKKVRSLNVCCKITLLPLAVLTCNYLIKAKATISNALPIGLLDLLIFLCIESN